MNSLAFDGTRNDTPVGYFTYTVDTDHWAWSSGLYALHGYEPHEVEATTELMLRHKHPEDMARSFDVLEKVVKDAAPSVAITASSTRRGGSDSSCQLGEDCWVQPTAR